MENRENLNHVNTVKSPARVSLFRACKSPIKIQRQSANLSDVKGLPPKVENLTKRSASKQTEGKKGDLKELAKDLRENFPEISENFDIVKKVGEGTFSKVYLAKYKDDPEQMVALKHLVPTSSPGRIENELNCLKRIGGSNNVIGINCTLRQYDHVVFVLPYYPHQKFSDFFRAMREDDIRKYMKNLFVALNHVHKKKVIHRDVKPSNFIYCQDRDTYSLIDFGLAMPVPGSESSMLKDYSNTSLKNARSFSKYNSNAHLKTSCRHTAKSLCSICKARSRQSAPRAGTPGFRSPEVLLKYPHQTAAVDMWSAGVILLCILSRRYPFFKAKDDLQALAQMMALFGSKQMERMASEIGKELMVSPPIVKQDTLEQQCKKLAKRVCPVHQQELFQKMRHGKRKRSEEFLEEMSHCCDSKRPLRNTRAIPDSILSKVTIDKKNANENLSIRNTALKENLNGRVSDNNFTCNCLGDSVYSLLERLLELNPLKRITAEEALVHPFIKQG